MVRPCMVCLADEFMEGSGYEPHGHGASRRFGLMIITEAAKPECRMSKATLAAL